MTVGITTSVAAVEPARLRSARSALGRSGRQSGNAFLQANRVCRICEDYVLERSLAGSAAATGVGASTGTWRRTTGTRSSRSGTVFSY